jgi:hypothetical protein
LEVLYSTGAEVQDVKVQQNSFSTKAAQLKLSAGSAIQFKIWGRVTDINRGCRLNHAEKEQNRDRQTPN